MSELAGFIDAILNDLDDDTPRLVFADWLDEHPEAWPELAPAAVQARAEFIRTQIARARAPEGDPRRADLIRREAKLLEAHSATWAKRLGHPVGYFSRGLAAGIEFVPHEFARRAGGLLAREPVELGLLVTPEVFTVQAAEFGTGEEVWASERNLRSVRRITSDRDRSTDRCDHELLVRLLASPHLSNLNHVSLFCVSLDAGGVLALLNSPAQFRLRSLELYQSIQNEEDAEETDDVVAAVAAIAASPKLSQLQRLELSFNGVGAESLRALLGSQTLPATMELEINEPDIGPGDPVSGPLGEQLQRRYNFAGLQ